MKIAISSTAVWVRTRFAFGSFITIEVLAAVIFFFFVISGSIALPLQSVFVVIRTYGFLYLCRSAYVSSCLFFFFATKVGEEV